MVCIVICTILLLMGIVLAHVRIIFTLHSCICVLRVYIYPPTIYVFILLTVGWEQFALIPDNEIKRIWNQTECLILIK